MSNIAYAMLGVAFTISHVTVLYKSVTAMGAAVPKRLQACRGAASQWPGSSALLQPWR